METKLTDTLKERGSVYGDYKGVVDVRSTIMNTISKRHIDVNGKPLTELDYQKLNDIVMKLARLAATPNHKDTWHDIAGYATLSEDLCNEV